MNKKIISLVLCITIFLPALFTGVISFANANPGNVNIPFIGNNPKPEIDSRNMNSTIDLVPEQENDKVLTVTLPNSKDEEVYKSTKNTLGVYDKDTLTADKKATSTDLYTLGKKEIEELLNDGYTIKQIFEADEIGNRVLENPANILKRSKNEKKELKDIEKAIIADRKQKQFIDLKSKYSKEYMELKNEQLNDQDISMLLVFYDKNDVKSLKELAKQYKKDGDKALSKALKTKESLLSKAKMDTYKISEVEAEGLNDEMIASLVELSKKTNKPVKDLIKGMKVAQSRMEGNK